jgi:hypothetical protein
VIAYTVSVVTRFGWSRRCRRRRICSACWAWGKSMPVDRDRIFRVRISRRPWPRAVSRWASGTAGQGRAASCACRLGVESDRGAVSAFCVDPFPRPAPRTGRASFPASRLSSAATACVAAHGCCCGSGRRRSGSCVGKRQGNIVAASTYSRVWEEARRLALVPRQVDSPLAGRPYDLRHSAVSLWLNTGVPATEVAVMKIIPCMFRDQRQLAASGGLRLHLTAHRGGAYFLFRWGFC